MTYTKSSILAAVFAAFLFALLATVHAQAASCPSPQETCRVIYSDAVGHPTTLGATVYCAADEYLRTGGGECEVPSGLCEGVRRGYLHISRPTDDGRGWMADCYSPVGENAPGVGGPAPADVCNRAFAVCCKTVTP